MSLEQFKVWSHISEQIQTTFQGISPQSSGWVEDRNRGEMRKEHAAKKLALGLAEQQLQGRRRDGLDYYPT